MFTGVSLRHGSTNVDGEGDKKVNLWYTLLKNVAKRDETRVANLLVLGDKGAGKRSLIKSLNKPFLK
jgi:predicted AAA+ superfamily ATPase